MAISDRINEMYTHVGDVYDTITNVDLPTNKNIQNIPQTIKDSYLEIMNNGIDTIWNNWEKVTGSGTSISLSPTLKAPMKNELKGNTYQTQYSGKNLLPPTIATETKNGITLTNNGDGSYTLTGSYSGSSTTFDMALPATLNGTYSFSGNNPASSNNIQFRILKSSGSPWSTYLNKVNSISEDNTIENGITQEVRIVGSFTSGFTFKPQLESGSTATSYEPYVGGVATPNPTNPTPVNVVSGDNEVHIDTKNKISFKNLTDSTLRGVDVTYNNSEVKLNGTTTSSGNIIQVGTNLQLSIPAGTYTFSLRVKSGSNSGIGGGNDMAIYLTKSSGSSTSVWLASMTISQINNGSGIKSATFTTETPVNLYIYTYANNSGITFENYTLEAQIEEGNSMTSYVPYDGDIYNIDLPVENYIPFPYIDISVTSRHGIDYTINSDNSITISGKATQNTAYTIANQTTTGLRELLLNNDCYLSGGARGGSSSTYTLQLYGYGSTGAGALRDDDGDGKSLSSFENESANFNIAIFIANGTEITTPITFKPMLEIGNKKNSYTPYGTTPIELCKIGNYQDYFYKDSGKWYLHKEIGKYTFTGNESVTLSQTANVFYINNSYDNALIDDISTPLCTIFQGAVSRINASTVGNNANNSVCLDKGTNKRFYFKTNVYSTTTDLATGLTGQSIYWIYETPTNTEITNTTLINQLEELYIAKSKENQTNISQINNDLPFIISASALKKGDTIENNSASLLMSFGALPNTIIQEATPDFEEDVLNVEEEIPIEEETEIEEEGE